MGLPFFKPKAKRRDQILAIDLGGARTKAVSLQRKGDQFCLEGYAVVDALPADKATNPEALSEHIKEVSRKANGRTKQLTLAIGVQDTIFRHLEMPLMPIGDLRRMLKFNSKNYLQQDLPDYVFDGCYMITAPPVIPADASQTQIRTRANAKQKVAIGGVRKKLLEDVAEAVRTAGMLPDVVVPGLVGPINAFELAESQAFNNEVVALVDIGLRYTSINILSTGTVSLNRVINFGGENLTKGLGDSMGISSGEAEGLKVGMTTEIQEALELLLNPLGRELRASVDFFEHQQEQTVSQVYLSGGTAQNEVILQILQTELMVPCKTWNPVHFLETKLAPDQAENMEDVAPQLTVAIGAAASGF